MKESLYYIYIILHIRKHYFMPFFLVFKIVESLQFILKDTLKAFDYFKNKQKSTQSNVFLYVEVCIF